MAHFLKTRVPKENYTQNCCQINDITLKGIRDGACGCALNYCKVSGALSQQNKASPAHFGITYKEFNSIFWYTKAWLSGNLEDRGPTPKQKAKQIEKLVERYGYVYAK